MWARYHESDPAAFLSGSGRWSVAQNAPREVRATATDTGQTTVQATSQQQLEQRVPPYYALLRLPDEQQPAFVTLRTFVPFNEDDSLRQLTSLMVADSSGDPERYGRLKAYEFTNSEAPGPAAVSGSINAKQEIATQVSLLNQQGSTVEYGDLLLIPIDESILYVRPLYVRSRDSDFPGLQFVIVSDGERVEFGGSLGQALDKLFPFAFGQEGYFEDLLGTTAVQVPPVDTPETPPTGEAPPPASDAPPTGEAPPAGEESSEQIRALVERIVAAQAEADAILRDDPGNFGAWGQKQAEVRALLAQLAQLTGVPSVPANGAPGGAAGAGAGDGEAAGTGAPSSTSTPVRPASA